MNILQRKIILLILQRKIFQKMCNKKFWRKVTVKIKRTIFFSKIPTLEKVEKFLYKRYMTIRKINFKLRIFIFY